MTITKSDIKLLKSAVMNDTSDGGGAMTGTVVVDGQSNNLYPDTSEMDRAFGRVNLRKLFGVAHTDTTESLLGAHLLVTRNAEDPLVHCTILQTPGWADTRETAKALIERYLVKGPRINCRLYDTHYSGSLTLRLYMPQGTGEFPAGGDAVVLRTPTGVEQYVRVLRTTVRTQTVAVTSGQTVVNIGLDIAECDLSTALAYDFLGAPAAQVVIEASYSSVYTTTPAPGAKFYGVKKLKDPVAVGDYTATTTDGIFTPLVPAATTETAITDRYPLQSRQAIVETGTGSIVVTAYSVTWTTASVPMLYLPTSVKPSTLYISGIGPITLADDGKGGLFAGASQVGTVDYSLGQVTFTTTIANYAATAVIQYTPTTKVGATAYSKGTKVTTTNQGLAWTDTLFPIPADKTLKVSYMAQGRWYDLVEDGTGKLAGGDSSYGVGTLNRSTGSVALTLGALPDVDSFLVYLWGDKSTATSIATKPTKAVARLPLGADGGASSLTVTWSRGGTNYTATMVNGSLTGSATGKVENGNLVFSPNVFPTGQVTVTYLKAPTVSTAYTGSGLSVTADSTPLVPGTVKARALVTFNADAPAKPSFIDLYDDGNGGLLADYAGKRTPAGTINYSTGAINVLNTATLNTWSRRVWGLQTFGPGQATYNVRKWETQGTTVTFTGITGVSYGYGTTTETTLDLTPSWQIEVAMNGLDTMVTDGVAFTLGDSLYTSQAGVLRQGWVATSGLSDVPNAGGVINTGIISVTSLPPNGQNTITWYNLAQDISYKDIEGGIFRTESAPLKSGVFQLQSGALQSSSGNDNNLTGDFEGTVDVARGIVRWTCSVGASASDLSYNTVFLQYLPLNANLLGLDTARLPLDGKVPIFRQAELVVLHNTQTKTLPNPLTKGLTYSVDRVRVANMKVVDSAGTTVPDTLYTTDLDAGTLVFPVGADISAYIQPFSVEHRIEDMMLCSQADISGKLTFTRAVTHDYPANTSYLSSALAIGDLYARSYASFEQSSWNGTWSDVRQGSAPTANYNEALYPIQVTNRGAITERWALVFTNTTTFNIIGENVGVIGTGSTGVDCAPVNPATGAPYFTIKAEGWGTGWFAGAVYRHNTQACGAPFWTCRTVLQGPATLLDDKFAVAFRGDVDRP